MSWFSLPQLSCSKLGFTVYNVHNWSWQWLGFPYSPRTPRSLWYSWIKLAKACLFPPQPCLASCTAIYSVRRVGNGLTLLLPRQPCWTMEITVYAVHKGNSSKRQQRRFFSFSLFKLYSSSLWKEHPQWSWQHQGTSVQHCMKSNGHRATQGLTAVEMCSSIIIGNDGLATRWVFG